jgi:hypothetical protein
LLTGLIDYAGLFPPAQLPLDEAIRNYAQYRQSPEAWMLGRFICPAARLAELAPHVALFQAGEPFAFSALGRGSKNAAELLANLQADFRDIAAFRERHGPRVTVDVLEWRLPAGASDGEVRDVAALIERAAPATLRTFFEFSVAGDWPATMSRQLALLRQGPLGARTGLKLRCAAPEGSVLPPSPREVAVALRAALDAGAPFKATAGLHHPFPRLDHGAQTVTMHGFINLFVAGALAHCRGLGDDSLRVILADNEPARFRFEEDGVRWQRWHASTAEIAAARRDAVLSFGSCSFDEPRDDLRALGWL